MKKLYGYVRVSTKEQNEDRQLLALIDYGVPQENLVIEKQSGKDFERPKYKKLLRKLKAEDVLVIKSIDRLGRNYDEILEQWRIIIKDKNADIVVLDMPLLDTRSEKDLMGRVIADVVLQLLSFVSQTEREFIHQRQAEGIAVAKQKGVQFGRPMLDVPENFIKIKEKYDQREITVREAAMHLGVSHTTFLRWIKKENYA